MPTSIAPPSVGRAGLPPQQRGHADQPGERDQPRARLGRVEVAAQHAQRRHAAQREHRRRAEREQHHHADAVALQRRHQPAGGIDSDSVRASQPPTTHCSANAIATPSALANRPSSTISPTWMPTSVRWLAPRQRITAAPDRWRSLCRRAAIATATAASTTDTSAARPRKRPARSSAERISGRASPMVSSRWPRPSAGLTVAHEALDRGRVAGDHEPVADAAAFLHQAGRGQVGQVEEHLGRDVEIVERGVGLLQHQRGQAQSRIADARSRRRPSRRACRRRRGSSTPCPLRGMRRGVAFRLAARIGRRCGSCRAAGSRRRARAVRRVAGSRRRRRRRGSCCRVRPSRCAAVPARSPPRAPRRRSAHRRAPPRRRRAGGWPRSPARARRGR